MKANATIALFAMFEKLLSAAHLSGYESEGELRSVRYVLKSGYSLRLWVCMKAKATIALFAVF